MCIGAPGTRQVDIGHALVGRQPLQIDSTNADAIEAGVRAYAGKPIINSVNGKKESLQAVLPIAKHYGCAVVGLTLDEGGIPPTAEERFAIAERIVHAAEAAGIPRQDVLIDCLVMAASTNQSEVVEILRAITLVKERLGVRTVLGVSNGEEALAALEQSYYDLIISDIMMPKMDGYSIFGEREY